MTRVYEGELLDWDLGGLDVAALVLSHVSCRDLRGRKAGWASSERGSVDCFWSPPDSVVWPCCSCILASLRRLQQQLALASFTATSSVIWRTTKFAPLEGEQWRSTRWEHLTRECRNLVIHKCSLSTHASTWLFPHSPQPWGQWVQNWHPVKAARSITLMIFSIFAPFDYGCIAVLTSISSERQSFPMLSVYLANQHY